MGTWRISNYTPEFRETSGVGKRKLLTMDEVLRLPVNRALVIARGNKVLQVDILWLKLLPIRATFSSRTRSRSSLRPLRAVSARSAEQSC